MEPEGAMPCKYEGAKDNLTSFKWRYGKGTLQIDYFLTSHSCKKICLGYVSRWRRLFPGNLISLGVYYSESSHILLKEVSQLSNKRKPQKNNKRKFFKTQYNKKKTHSNLINRSVNGAQIIYLNLTRLDPRRKDYNKSNYKTQLSISISSMEFFLSFLVFIGIIY